MKIKLEAFPNSYLALSRAHLRGNFAEFHAQLSQVNDVAFIDRGMALNPLQLATAASSALGAFERGEMLTRGFGTELLYKLSGSNNVAESLRLSGVKENSSEILVAALNRDPIEVLEAAPKLLKLLNFEDGDDDIFVPDMALIRKAFKLPANVNDISYITHHIINIISTKDC